MLGCRVRAKPGSSTWRRDPRPVSQSWLTSTPRNRASADSRRSPSDAAALPAAPLFEPIPGRLQPPERARRTTHEPARTRGLDSRACVRRAFVIRVARVRGRRAVAGDVTDAAPRFRHCRRRARFERRWPGAEIRFVLNRQAAYATSCPYPGLLLDDSPTRRQRRGRCATCSRSVPTSSSSTVPAGWSSTVPRARSGGRVVYVSSRPKTRWKGFRLRRMRVMDQHWIAQPRFFGGEATAYERLQATTGRPARTRDPRQPA